MKTKFLCILVALLFALPAAAANSSWTSTPGGKVRIIVDNPTEAAPEVRGAIQINLDPGWKTYWKEPGDAGVPPELDLSASTNIKGYALSFPTPHRFEDGGTQWAGYKKPVALPFTLTLADPAKPAHFTGHAFLGICETICIPVTAEFDISIDGTPSDALTKTQVSTAFGQLPAPASTAFGVRSVARDDDHLDFTADLPAGDEDIDLFVAGDGGANFGMSKLKSRDEKSAIFAVPVVSGTQAKPGPLYYTLVQGNKAVSGTITVKE
ncbi:MAG: protein-disulfide reductase DsbD domain-containing protein [Phyllobacterium sp.]|uniref:protein-disulfide reductase DsbD domain-containing protein n=1 Tax=Phyllobacterium sp. TaxID=1871046 RepID=UPI0030F323E0